MLDYTPDDPVVVAIAKTEVRHHRSALNRVAARLREIADKIERESADEEFGTCLLDGNELAMIGLEVERRSEAISTYSKCAKATPSPAPLTAVEAAAKQLVDVLAPLSGDLACIKAGRNHATVTRKGEKWPVLLVDRTKAINLSQAMEELRALLRR